MQAGIDQSFKKISRASGMKWLALEEFFVNFVYGATDP